MQQEASNNIGNLFRCVDGRTTIPLQKSIISDGIKLKRFLPLDTRVGVPPPFLPHTHTQHISLKNKYSSSNSSGSVVILLLCRGVDR